MLNCYVYSTINKSPMSLSMSIKDLSIFPMKLVY